MQEPTPEPRASLAPLPLVRLEFSVERHPDARCAELIAQIEELEAARRAAPRAESDVAQRIAICRADLGARLKEIHGTHTR